MELKTNEVLNYLLAHKDLKIIQRRDMFNFSLDTVLLANFASITRDTHRIIDLGTNNAAIPLLLSKRTKVPVLGIEIQEEAAELAQRNIALNHLEDQITIVCDDMKSYAKSHPKAAKLVICNPPFFKIDEHSNLNDNEYLRIARHEVKITLSEIIETARMLLEYRGRFAMIHRPDRLIDIIELMKHNDIEPKRLRFVYPKIGKDSHMVLVEGVYKGQPGLKIEPPLYAHHEDGTYTEEIRMMFGEKKNV